LAEKESGMSPLHIANLAVFLFVVLVSLFYASSDQETQGAVVMLLGILYFVALPHLKES
jgi:hypothetical protein